MQSILTKRFTTSDTNQFLTNFTNEFFTKKCCRLTATPRGVNFGSKLVQISTKRDRSVTFSAFCGSTFWLTELTTYLKMYKLIYLSHLVQIRSIAPPISVKPRPSLSSDIDKYKQTNDILFDWMIRKMTLQRLGGATQLF